MKCISVALRDLQICKYTAYGFSDLAVVLSFLATSVKILPSRRCLVRSWNLVENDLTLFSFTIVPLSHHYGPSTAMDPVVTVLASEA